MRNSAYCLSVAIIILTSKVLAKPYEPLMYSSGAMEEKMAQWEDMKRKGEIGVMKSSAANSGVGVPCIDNFSGSFPCQGVDMVAFLSLSNLGCNSKANDVWGWIDDDLREYTLAGCDNGVSFVDITDPYNPFVIGFLPTYTSSSSWRDIKVFQNHAFVGSEASNHGIQIFDLSQLSAASSIYLANPDNYPVSDSSEYPNMDISFSSTAYYSGDSGYDVGNSHNVVINEATGIMYVVGGSNGCGGGLHMVDISNPTAPTFAGCFGDDGYTHDAQCVIYSGPDTRYIGREICFAYNEDTITIIDVTDKSSPTILSRACYSGRGYIHQGWLNDAQTHLMMDDELDERRGNVALTTTRIFDVTSLTAPFVNGMFTSTKKDIDHNQYYYDGLMYQANYCGGLRVLDARQMHLGTASEIAYFRVGLSSSCTDDFYFAGAWSVYPYYTGNIIALNVVEDGLFLLKLTSQKPNLPTTPTAAPTIGGPAGIRLPAYSTSNTNSGSTNTVDYAVPNVCGGDEVVFTTCAGIRSPGCSCDASVDGDTWLRLFDGLAEVASNDDECEQCSTVQYVHTAPQGTACKTLMIKQGCYGNNACSAETLMIGKTEYVEPTDPPTMMPVPCTPCSLGQAGSTCSTDVDCCSGNCRNKRGGTCGPYTETCVNTPASSPAQTPVTPPTSSCSGKQIGARCAKNNQCCSGNCQNRVCAA